MAIVRTGSGQGGAGDLVARLTRHADLALAAVVVASVAMMIVPLPGFLLDLLISFNIAVAVTLLLISIYVADALKIATFPTLLLLTTLFRVALEVSATRLILLKANAGEVIHAFGGFVVAGNLVVGAVIFVILTLVQFIVISKGAERVAEVAARFTLDALPGKQMAIDAELRAGHLDAAGAQRRRALLSRESQFFGAMDGAMRFVKGDAVAGIIVLAVNIVGGLVIGVAQRGMDIAAAARTYTLLTIGEGLVAQIPALVISTAAGIVVTRVAAEDEGAHLGREIGAQVLAQPRALAVAAALLALLGIVPGLPATPFLILAAVLGALAWRLISRPPAPRAQVPAPPDASAGTAAARLPAPRLTPLAVELSPELAAELRADADRAFANDALDAARARLFEQSGLTMPPVHLRAPVDPRDALPGRSYRIHFNEIPLARIDLPRGRDATEEIASGVMRLMRRRGHELLGIQETQALLTALEPSHPALVREVVPKVVSPAQLCDVLRRLAAEGISLRQLPEILGAVADAPAAARDPATLAERARAALRAAITFAHAGAAGRLTAIALDPLVEETLREAIRPGDAGGHLALPPGASHDILAGVGRALAVAGAALPRAAAGAARGAVIVTAGDLRRHVRRLVEVAHPDLAVLSYAELAPETEIDTVARVSVA
jgi:type III secretion protein V